MLTAALVAVDPGLRACGVAAFGPKDELVWAALVKNPVREARGPEAWEAMASAVRVAAWAVADLDDIALAVEVPQVYRMGHSKGDPADLIELAGVDGAVVYALTPQSVAGYLPREWKGQVPKDVMGKRIEAHLSATERAAIQEPAPSLRHNVLDAIGIGLHHLGRL